MTAQTIEEEKTITATHEELKIESPEDAAAVTGIKAERIGIVRLQLERLLTEGILIDLNINGESMFMRSAEWSEIGIQDGEVRSNRMTRGQKYLIDEGRIKELRTITTRMRQWLEKMTPNINGFRPWRYLYYKRYNEWVEKWAELTRQFYAVKENILEHYDSDIDALRRDYVEIAERSWTSISSLGYESIIYDGISFTNQAEFSQRMVQKVLSKVPSRSQIERELNADYRVSVIQGREQIENNILRSEESKARHRILQAQSDAQVQEAYAKSDKLFEEKRHEEEMNRLAEEEKRTAIEAMIKAEAAHIRDQFAEQVSPIEEVFSQVRNEIASVCIEAAESIQKNGHVRGQTAEKLKGLVEFYKITSIEDDPKLLKKLQDLKTVIGQVGGTKKKDSPARNPDEVITALKQVIDLKNTIHEDIMEGPSRFAFMFTPEV